jgi:TolB-like protein/class 3 adenylate cyclase/tetratricopeptide (TPR) repeat protein
LEFARLEFGGRRLLAMERRLAAILAADIAGFARLMGADEEGTHTALRSHREIADRLIGAQHGRVFASAGDSVIAEFASAVEAVQAAVEIQREIARRNKTVPADKRLCFRIGLNIGDVMVEGDNLFGDGVNVAARVQALAKPGGICVSRNVYNQVKNKIAIAFEDLGEHRLKNIAEPLTVYRVLTDATAGRSRVLPLVVAMRRQRLALAGLAILVVCGLGAAGWYAIQRGPGHANKPAIAVLPLDSIGSDEATDRLADGLSEDIITDLARFRDLDVIARNSTMIYKGKAVDIRQIGRDLDVDYILEGSVQRHAEQIRITAQLIDAVTGTHLWADSWDRPLTDTFEVQTEVAERVAGLLGSLRGVNSITSDQIRRLKGRPPASFTAYDNYLLAVEASGVLTKESISAGIDYATKAIALDPNFGRAYGIRARLEYNSIHNNGVDYDTAMGQMEADARRAVELDPNSPDTRAARAWYFNNAGRQAEAEAEIRAAVAVNPSNVGVLHFAAAILAVSANPEEGAELADKVLRIDPRADTATLLTIKDAYFYTRRFDKLIAVVASVPENARSRMSRLYLAFSYALLGRKDEAERATAVVLSRYPNISAELLLNQGFTFARPQEEKLFLDGFRATGVALCASEADLAAITKPVRLPECMALTPK